MTSRITEETAHALKGKVRSPQRLLAQSQMVPKARSESAVSVQHAFASDAALKDARINPFGGPRFGVLMEDMDAIAGNVLSAR